MLDRSDSKQRDEHSRNVQGRSRQSSSLIVRNSMFNLLGMALIVPLNFVTLFILARRLGKESLGEYFTLFAISAVIFLLVSSGMTTVLVRRIAQSRNTMRKIVGEACGVLVVVCVVSVLMFLLAMIGWSALQGRSMGWAMLLAACVAIAARHTLEFEIAVMRGVERFELENIARVLQTGLYCLLVLLFVDSSPIGALVAFIAFAASNIVAAIPLAAILAGKWGCRSISLRRDVLSSWFSSAWPIGAGDVLRVLGWQLETLLLAILSAPAAVGLFSVAYRPLRPLQILPRSLVSVTFPMLSRAGADDRTTIRRTMANSTALLWLLSLPLALTVTICARPFLLATAGPAYETAILPLQLLIWLTGFTFINTQLRFVFSAIGWEHRYWKIGFSVLVVKVMAAVMFISLWGILGACMSVLVGEALLTGCGICWLRVGGFIEIPWRRLTASSAAAIATGLLLLPLNIIGASLIVSLIACGVATLVFLALCLAFGAIQWRDVTSVFHAFGEMRSRFVTRTKIVSKSEEPSDVTTCSVT